jgi:hypothetical protein
MPALLHASNRSTRPSCGPTAQTCANPASEDTSFWRELNVAGTASREYNATSAAAQLLAVIRKKAAKYASAQKKVLTLVLDAARTPNLTFSEVVTVLGFVGFSEVSAHFAKCMVTVDQAFLKIQVLGLSDTSAG